MEILSASDIYALANNCRNGGREECYWCGSKCGQLWRHDESPLEIGVRSLGYAKRPGNGWICAGCWNFRRRRVTVNFIDGTYVDGRTAQNFSWWFTPNSALAVPPSNNNMLFDKLLNPPNQFVLSLIITDPVISGYIGVPTGTVNRLQFMAANNYEEIKAETVLDFTVNNVPHKYSVYELEEAIKRDEPNGWEPGVRALISFLGKPSKKEEKNPSGRPIKEETHEGRIRRTVTGKK